MILPDVNVLLYAVNTDSPQFEASNTALTRGFEGDGVGLSILAIMGFLRISTRYGIFPTPLSTENALAVIDHWSSQPNAHWLNPGPKHMGIIGRLLLGAGRAGLLVPDAHLAALSIEHQVSLVTFDADFLAFPGLKLNCLSV